MSVDSAPSSPAPLPTYKHRVDLTLHSNKPLQSTLSQNDRIGRSSHSLKSPSKERYRQQSSNSRTRAQSISEETSADTITELTTIPSSSNKHDRRSSEFKSPVDQQNQTPSERRNSTPQLHFSALFPHAFRNAKYHHKTNTKDETNTTSTTSNNTNVFVATSPLHFADTMTMKTDLSFSLKSATTPSNGSRFTFPNNNERLSSSQNEDSISSSSFILEENTPELRSAESFILESHTPICVMETYHDNFFDAFHINYYGEFDYEGPFIASVRHIYHKTSMADNCEARAIIRTQYRNCDVSEMVNGSNENNILQILFHKAHLPTVRSYGTIGDPKANEKIHLFDKINDERFNCKIGVIHQRANQTNEYDIFSNDYLPNDMRELLDKISNRIYLKGFQKYRGDLDTKDDLHGEYSYYTQYEDHEIMFNIAPIIPSTKANGQCIERKGLIGNAFVCIVFQEAGAIFTPDFISGKVIQIYITVQPIMSDDQLYYKIGIWRRNDISSVIDPPGGTYKCDKSFRGYFLTLLLNTVNVAIESPSLRSRVYEQRQRLKCEELKKLSHTFRLGPIPDFTADLDELHSQIDARSNARSESFASNTTVTTSDSASTNASRTSPVSVKKKTLSRKILGVFSGRSASISAPSGSSNQASNDGIPISPQTPSSAAETMMTFGRTSNPLNKEPDKRTVSIKTNHAPLGVSRPSTSQIPQGISIQPPTPSFASINPTTSDNLTENNRINTAALNIPTRNRSNSSPEDIVNANKPRSSVVKKIDEEEDYTSTTSGSDDEDESSEDEKPVNRPLIFTSTIKS